MARNIGKWLGTKYDSQFESENTNVDRLSKWTGVSPQSVTEAQPLPTNFQFEDYNRLLGERGRIDPVYGDIDEQRAQAQSGAEKLGMILPRIATKVATEVAKIPGEVGGLAEWAFTDSSFAEAIDNAWTQNVQAAGDYINEEVLPVYKRREIEEGGFFKQITSPEFWATEGADGIGFLLSMMTPGLAIKGMGLGSKAITGLSKLGISSFGKAGKLTKFGAKAADTVNDYTAASVNTLVEAVAEGHETIKTLEMDLQNKKFQELINSGYEQEDAVALSEEYVKSPEVQAQISKAGYNVFTKNLAILIVPNILDQKWLFNGFNKAAAGSIIKDRMASAVGKTTDDALEGITRLTPKQIRGKFAGKVAVGVGKEGFFEEGMQYAASELEKNKVVDPDNATSLLETYAENLGETDMQKSIFLGALLGGGMGGIGGVRSAKREDEYLFGSEKKEYGKFRKFLGAKDSSAREGVINIFKNNFVKRYQSANDLVELDADGKPVLDEKGNPKLDLTKLAELGQEELLDAIDKERLSDFAREGNKEGYEYLKSIRDFKYMAPYMKEDGGYELLINHINNLANSELEEVKKTGLYPDTDVATIKQDLLKKAKTINDIYRSGEKSLVDLFEVNEDNKKYASRFSEHLLDTFASSKYIVNNAEARLSVLNNNVNTILSKGTQTKETSAEQLAPGQLIQENGEIKQVVKDKDGKLATINLQGKREILSKENAEDIQLITNITPDERVSLFKDLTAIGHYTDELTETRDNLEKLFTKDSQQKGFDEYTKGLNKVKREAEKIPTEDIKEKIETSETKEDITKVKDEIINSELSDKDKQTLGKDADDAEAMLSENEALKSMFGFTETAPKEELPDVSSLQFGTETPQVDLGGLKFDKPVNEQVSQGAESKTLDSSYEQNRNQESKQQELQNADNDLSESEYKTTFTNTGYLAVEYDKSGTVLKDKVDSKGNVKFGSGENLLPSLPDMYNPGTKLIMFIDDRTDPEHYEANKDNVDSIPIAIQTVEDYEAKKLPIMHLHRMDWIKPSRVAEEHIEKVTKETLGLRKLLYNTKGKYITEVLYKSPGMKAGTKQKNPKQFTVREVIGYDTNAILGVANMTGQLETNGSIEAINGSKLVSGIPYLVLPTANGSFYATWLKQEPINKNPNFTKYNKTVVAILEGFVNRTTSIKSMSELVDELNKYYHVNTGNIDEVLKNENKQLIFSVKDTSKGDLQVNLIVNENGKEVLYNYYFKEGDWIAYKQGDKNKVRRGINMVEELGKRIPNKYPNFSKKGFEAGKNFEVYELNADNKLVKVKKDYIDFISENGVVTSSVQSTIVNGKRVYFVQPNIQIETDLSKITPYETTQEEVEEVSPIDLIYNKIIKAVEEQSAKLEGKEKRIFDSEYSELLRDIEYLKSNSPLVTPEEFVKEHDTHLRKFISEDEIKSIISVENLVESEIISNFEELLQQLKDSKEALATEENIKKGEEIEKKCKGIIGKGKITSR